MRLNLRHHHDTHSVINVRARSRAIGRELRRGYDDIVMQTIPEEWMDILRQIDAKAAAERKAKAR